ncbi:MAG: flagellar basal body-associated FliL family protein [Gemmobacter sp.]|nr:flagellar basal body-associated FliL family protein [Gemmobacter sp.]
MADSTAPQEAAPALKRSKLPLILGLILALSGGGGGFYATYSGMILGHDDNAPAQPSALPDIAFVPLDPLVVSLGAGGRSRHLRFVAQLEVETAYRADVDKLKPRVLDLLNGYLRAVEPQEFDDPAALIRLRAQMLRRIQIVTGEGRVRDLLVTEFVLN